MNLNDTLSLIAARFDLDATELQQYAAEDAIGGYDSNPVMSKWEIGSIWGVEGQMLYALIRATKPKLCVQLGGWRGCSAMHIASALKANGSGKLVSVDRYGQDTNPTLNDVPVELVVSDGVEYVSDVMPKAKVDFLFEDMMHDAPQVEAVWKAVVPKVKKGAFVVSHDAMHFTVGADVRAGIEAAGVADALVVLAEPSDCGLAIWRKE